MKPTRSEEEVREEKNTKPPLGRKEKHEKKGGEELKVKEQKDQ